MAYELNASNLLNPMMVWSDLGLRALDMTLSSSQDIGENIERLTRASASASVEPVQDVVSRSTASHQSDFAIPSGVALSADLQRSALDLMMQGWMHGWTQWMSTLGSFASLAASLAPSRSRKSQSGVLGTMAKNLLPFADLDSSATRAHSSSRQHGGQRDTKARTASTEHAFASAEPHRRRGASRAKAKPRRSRGT